MKSPLRLMVLVSVLMSVAVAASAQDRSASEDPADSARYQWGALRFTPGISVTNMGIDNNVFNDPNNRIQDTTAAVGPAINAWTKIGPLHVSEKSAGQYLYFKQYGNQRSWNTSNQLRLDLPFARLKPFAEAGYVNTRQRPGVEIDARARATTNTAAIGTNIRISGKTTLVLSGTRTTTAFDQKETFLGTTLAQALDRHSDAELLQFRYTLTPLTTFVINTDAVQDRFASDRIRNADSYRVVPGFEFKPFALIAGKASVGFRHFNALNEGIEDYQGAVASVDARYMLTTSTQLSAKVDRDITFSYEETTPYYTLTETTMTVNQRIFGTWDIAAAGALQSLGYRGLRAAPVSVDRTDTARMVGLGLGYLVGETLRIGFDVNYYSRRSELAGRNYDGVRAGASVSYGLQR